VALRTDPALELRLDRLAVGLSRPGEERTTRGRAALAALLAGLDALEARIRAGEAIEAPGRRPRGAAPASLSFTPEGRAALERCGFDTVPPYPGRIADRLAGVHADLTSGDVTARLRGLASLGDLRVALDAYSAASGPAAATDGAA
jgi:predicted transcriptional regulator